jgi:hypothetical protein
MSHFQSWFQHRSVYLLPDGTPVVAQYFDFDASPRWGFVDIDEQGRMGEIVAAVFPDGRVWNYSYQPDRGVCVPQCSDMTIDDLRPTSPLTTVGSWVTRAGQVLALLCAVDGLSDMIGVAATVAA